LARGLLALGRSRRTGVLHVTSEFGECLISIVNGVPCAVSGSAGGSRTLGDALVDDGALEPGAHHEAWLGRAADETPIGAWLVESGLASRIAVDAALRTQLRERIMRLLDARGLEYRFLAGSPEIGAESVDEPMAACDLVLGALRARLLAWPPERLARTVGDGELRLTGLGRDLVRCAALWPEEAAVSTLLARGATLTQLLQATRGSARALRFLALLTLLCAINSETKRDRKFSLLVRKRDQLTRNAGAHALLDLPVDAAPEQARRALRRLARELHPDALGADAPTALRRASGEVLGALIDAERELRARSSSL